ncbi:MAG: polysaccharide deacetylase family protein [Prevotellaceae bacterium]|jgi:polysaccharide deacetylase family protein (PEP-CTERM system associated)|nr:polysaccharide deacetylase family protein [Prevotellaceae bacterium]
MRILTFDIEDWWAYDYYKIGDKRDWLPRIDNYLDETLDLLDERNTKATFFILGKLAKDWPKVVTRITSRGHHIGCHSFSHKFWNNSTPKEVAEDTHKALDIIENITGKKVDAYRAPAFSVTEKNSWILSILAENGIEYDCSIFPSTRSYGGFPSYKTKLPSVIHINGTLIKEFPVVTASILGREVAYSGGGYFRMFPYWKIRSLVQENEYVMTYFHIKDFDKDQIRTYRSFEGESAISRYFKKYYGLKGNFSKFCKVVNNFDFISVEQADKMINWAQQPRIIL